MGLDTGPENYRKQGTQPFFSQKLEAILVFVVVIQQRFE